MLSGFGLIGHDFCELIGRLSELYQSRFVETYRLIRPEQVSTSTFLVRKLAVQYDCQYFLSDQTQSIIQIIQICSILFCACHPKSSFINDDCVFLNQNLNNLDKQSNYIRIRLIIMSESDMGHLTSWFKSDFGETDLPLSSKAKSNGLLNMNTVKNDEFRAKSENGVTANHMTYLEKLQRVIIICESLTQNIFRNDANFLQTQISKHRKRVAHFDEILLGQT